MANLTAIPTNEGIEILNSELKEQVSDFVLIGAQTFKHETLSILLENTEEATYEELRPYVFYRNQCAAIYYDENGVLTFEAELPLEEDLEKYTFAIGILAKGDVLVCLTPTPKIVLIRGVGGVFVIKIAVRGVAGEIVFQSGVGVTRGELEVYRNMILKPVVEIANAQLALTNQLISKGVLSE
ncbi:hypothetical protein [Helicobacter rodentium]|uniref:hypothetical protein n=1 Tax=Helicobacter rodentium TaxID=59617 RepID=UPI0023F51F4D|nr:hypothetical protein [Helicobacter rodentium]